MFSGVNDQRFSLRMLEPNEYYFDDYSVDYYPKGMSNASDDNFAVVQGTLKVCSRSIVFVPSNGYDPLIRVKQKDITDIKFYSPSDTSHLKTRKVCSARCIV
jgi:factor associated with neutral sphingomyelinase activation